MDYEMSVWKNRQAFQREIFNSKFVSKWILYDKANLHDTSSLHTPWSPRPFVSSDLSPHLLLCLYGGWNVQPLLPPASLSCWAAEVSR